jgi:hypothetical protein
MDTEQPKSSFAYTSALSGSGATTRKVALADVLWTAANEHLSDDGWWKDGRSTWSCNAVAKAATRDRNAVSTDLPEPVEDFLRQCGCRTSKENYTFGKRNDTDRQGVRYMWLLLAMHVAEDEAIQIEVPA